MDEPYLGSGISYDDVFGGPPRYAAALFASQGSAPGAGVDASLKAPSRVPSFRGSSLPVFELPAFGDDAPDSVLHGSRSTSIGYDDLFSERGIRGPLLGTNLSVGSVMRSKLSSPSISSHHSPVHPGVSLFCPMQEDEHIPNSSVLPLQKRLAVRKLLRFTTSLSFDESKGKPVDCSTNFFRTDPTSSLPSSPPRVGPLDPIKSSFRSNSGNNVIPFRNELDVDLDEVFCSFPQRISSTPHPFSVIHPQVAPRGTVSISETSRSKSTEKPIAKPRMQGSRHPVSCSLEDTFKSKGTSIPSSMEASSGEHVLHNDFIELTMHGQRGFFISRKDKPEDVNSKPRADSPLKCRSWKDWISECSLNHSGDFVPDARVAEATAVNTNVSEDEDALCGFIDEWVKDVSVILPEQPADKIISKASILGDEMNVQGVEGASEMENKNMLANAWNLNEEREGKNNSSQPLQEAQDASEETLILHWKKLRKQTSRQVRVSQQEVLQANENHIDKKKQVGLAEEVTVDCTGVQQGFNESDIVLSEGSNISDAGSVLHGVGSVEAASHGISSMTNILTTGTSVRNAENVVDDARKTYMKHLMGADGRKGLLTENRLPAVEAPILQPTRQQMAGASDTQIKRWATGKEGNIRALLSNLQHVLWPESGWQPIPLTELIEGAAVKKAYRKATLFVHPDKMQQKGATEQQKYVAEKVFAILQEAWTTFTNHDLF